MKQAYITKSGMDALRKRLPGFTQQVYDDIAREFCDVMTKAQTLICKHCFTFNEDEADGKAGAK